MTGRFAVTLILLGLPVAAQAQLLDTPALPATLPYEDTLSVSSPAPLASASWNRDVGLTLAQSGVGAAPMLLAQADASPAPPRGAPDQDKTGRPQAIWEEGVGEGFSSTARSFGVSVGGNYGVAMLGGREAHHLVLASVSYGHMLGPVQGKGHWYRGNFEWRLELFGGFQVRPDVGDGGWLIGLTPHLRYSFATGTRWVPFVDAGAGVTATGIGAPDLSGTFEFNLQPGAGVHWFLKDNLALTAEARYLHLSCARINEPNLGLNGVTGLLGLTCFF